VPTLFDFAKPRTDASPAPNSDRVEPPVTPLDRKRIVLCRMECKTLSAIIEGIGLVTDEAELLFTRDGLRVECATDDSKLGCHVTMTRSGLRDSDIMGNGICVPVNIQALLMILRKFKFPADEFITVILNAESERFILQAKGRHVPVIKVSVPTIGKIHPMPVMPAAVPDCSFVMTMKRTRSAIETLKSVGKRASTFLEQDTLVMAVNNDSGECTVRIKAGRGKAGLMQLHGSLPASMAFDLDLLTVARVLKIISPLHEAIRIQLAASHAATFTTWFNHNTGTMIFAIAPWAKATDDKDEPKVERDDEGDENARLAQSDFGLRTADDRSRQLYLEVKHQ